MKNLSIEYNNIIFNLEKNLLGAVLDILVGKIKNYPLKKLTKNKNSPIIIPFAEVENSFIIFYPPNSDHYVEKWYGKSKSCLILSGTIYESTNKMVYEEGDYVELLPDTKYDPYTLKEMCIAFVKIL